MLSHIALLVSSVDQSAAYFRQCDCEVGPREVFDGEGTTEIYIGGDMDSARILLMEASGPGAYQRAMKRRGPGLHHIAMDVANLDACVSGLSGSGWYLHPMSINTIKKTRTAWLARPGTAALIEIQEREVIIDPPFVTKLEIPMTSKEESMFAALKLETVVKSTSGMTKFHFAGNEVSLQSLLK